MAKISSGSVSPNKLFSNTGTSLKVWIGIKIKDHAEVIIHIAGEVLIGLLVEGSLSVVFILVNAFIATRALKACRGTDAGIFPIKRFRSACHGNIEVFSDFAYQIAVKIANDTSPECAQRAIPVSQVSQNTQTDELELMKKLQEMVANRYRQKFFASSHGSKLRLTKWKVPHVAERPAKVLRVEKMSIYNKAARSEFLSPDNGNAEGSLSANCSKVVRKQKVTPEDLV